MTIHYIYSPSADQERMDMEMALRLDAKLNGAGQTGRKGGKGGKHADAYLQVRGGEWGWGGWCCSCRPCLL